MSPLKEVLPGTVSTLEMDSRAETRVLGLNFIPMMHTNQSSGAHGFSGSSEIQDVPGGTAWTDPRASET